MFIVCVIIFMVDFACRFREAVDGERAFRVHTTHSTYDSIEHTHRQNHENQFLSVVVGVFVTIVSSLLYLSTYWTPTPQNAFTTTSLLGCPFRN